MNPNFGGLVKDIPFLNGQYRDQMRIVAHTKKKLYKMAVSRLSLTILHQLGLRPRLPLPVSAYGIASLFSSWDDHFRCGFDGASTPGTRLKFDICNWLLAELQRRMRFIKRENVYYNLIHNEPLFHSDSSFTETRCTNWSSNRFKLKLYKAVTVFSDVERTWKEYFCM